jgi:hypothetical protein
VQPLVPPSHHPRPHERLGPQTPTGDERLARPTASGSASGSRGIWLAPPRRTVAPHTPVRWPHDALARPNDAAAVCRTRRRAPASPHRPHRHIATSPRRRIAASPHHAHRAAWRGAHMTSAPANITSAPANKLVCAGEQTILLYIHTYIYICIYICGAHLTSAPALMSRSATSSLPCRPPSRVIRVSRFFRCGASS